MSSSPMPAGHFGPSDLIAAVEQSPALVAVHDRDRWCGLYARDGQVNDPVGSRPHDGRAAIERFYDTFIAPNRIVFHVEHDVVCGMSVMRDLGIATTMSTGLTLHVPMHLRYDLVDEGGQLRIRRLYAHWELPYMIGLLLRSGPRGWWTAIKLGPQLLANQGIGGMLGFMRGFLGIGRAGKRIAARFLDALIRGDTGAAQSLLADGVMVECPYGRPVPLAELPGRLRGLRYGKVMAAGRTVTATVHHDAGRGVVLFRFDDDRRLDGVEFFI